VRKKFASFLGVCGLVTGSAFAVSFVDRRVWAGVALVALVLAWALSVDAKKGKAS
jgi:hypothetical protein